MPKIRQYCSRIHGKIGTRSGLEIGLWAYTPLHGALSNGQFYGNNPL
jgi:hypothetical protein